MKNRLALAIALMVAIFSFLNLSSGGGGAYYDNGLTDVFEQVILDRRNLRHYPRPHAVDNTPDDCKELRIPEWLSSDAGRKLADNKSFPNGDSSGVTGTADSQTPLAPYTIEDLLDASSLFQDTYGLLVYDPVEDDFKLFYNNQKHKWIASCVKLSVSFQVFTELLRQSFPDRFQGKKSSELVIGIGSGDYPHLNHACYYDFPHSIPGDCNETASPILQFGSIFRHAEMLPNMIAMPNPGHLKCFLKWGKKRQRCELFDLGVVQDSESNFKDLIPQVIWRGTDFSYLTQMHNLALNMPDLKKDIESKITQGMGQEEMKTVAVNTMKELYDGLIPRWQGVVLTADAELEAEKKMKEDAHSSSSSLPWVNIKFSSGNTDKLAGFAKYGIPAQGESIWGSDLASYRYHIDLGGGGGTTWTGTIYKASLNGLLFHHVTPTKDFIHDYLIPWVHYIPVAGDLRDLKEKYDWAEEHPQIAKSISENGSKLVRHLVSPEGMDEMYNQFIIKPMRRIIDAYQPVSVAHPGLSWREVLKENLEGDNMGLRWRCTGYGKNCTQDQTVTLF